MGLLPCPEALGGPACSLPIAQAAGPLPGVSREGKGGGHRLD